MQQPRFEFYVIHSNPSHPEVPRLFFVKILNNRISWSIELDEVNDVIIKSEFDKEEAEFWGTLEKIENDTVKVRLKDDSIEETWFSDTMMWNLETLMIDNHAIIRCFNKIYLGRPVDRNKYRNDPAALEAELRHFKNKMVISESKQNRYDVFEDDTEYAKSSKKKTRK